MHARTGPGGFRFFRRPPGTFFAHNFAHATLAGGAQAPRPQRKEARVFATRAVSPGLSSHHDHEKATRAAKRDGGAQEIATDYAGRSSAAPQHLPRKKQRASYPGALRAQRLAMRRERCGRPRPSCALAAEVCDRHKATPYKRLRRQLRREAVFVASCAGRGACAGRRAAGREKAPAAVAARAGDQNGSSSIVGRCARSLTRRSASRLNFRRAAAWSSLRGAVFASAKASSAPS